MASDLSPPPPPSPPSSGVDPGQPNPPPHSRRSSHTSRSNTTTRRVLHTAWPLAAVGALSVLAGNPLQPSAPPTAPETTQPAAGLVGTTTTSVSPGSYIAPDGRSFAALVAQHVLPDPTVTTGVVNPDVSQDNIKTTVCKSGWTATVRPDVAITDAIKKETTPAGHAASEYELDHLMSIEDGGAPNDRQNLWMQVYNDPYGARTKDVLETKLKKLVCAGTITLNDARAALVPNWLIGYEKYVGDLPTGN